jgi:pimeloyl-ACP methyl ester carboxylesterase
MDFPMIFLHGLESSSQTYKAGVIRNAFPELIVPDFSGTLEERMTALYPILGDQGNWTIIGSSFGGLMAAIFTCQYPSQVRKLVLLAPALMLPEFAPFLDKEPISVPTTIIHGKQDEIVPVQQVRNIAERVFSALTYQLVNDDHRLHKATDMLDWKAILS